MSTEFFNDQWRIPSNDNQNKVSNYSMDFNGTSDFIDCSNITGLNNLSAFSTSTWINYSGTLSTSHIFLSGGISLSNRFYIQLKSSTQIRYGSGSDFDDVTVSTINSGSWHHIVTVHNGTSLDIYLDGVKQNSSPVTVVAPNTNIGDDFTIGRYTISPGYYWNGKIDQVTVFDYALSSSQVSTLYGGGTAITNPMTISPKPISYYQLGDQSVDNGANYLVPNNSLSDYVFSFDGNNDYIDCGNITALNLQSAFSTSAWINYSGVPSVTSHVVLSGGSSSISTNRFWYQLISSNIIRYGSGSASDDVTISTISSGSWHHIATVHNGTSLDIYLDGVKQNSSPVTVLAPNTQLGNNFTIGEYFSIVNYLFDGELSNISVFNTALSTGNIETLYNNGAPNDISSLSPVGWWKLNAADTFDGSNWTINDYGSGGNDGTSSGMDSSNLVVSDLQQTSGYSPYALSLDGINDYLDCGDSDTFSFGNSTTDSPFSISAWIYMNDATTFRIVSKVGTNGNEYFLSNGGDDKLNFILYDTFGSGNIRAKYDTALTSYEGQWIHIVGTYSGVNRQNGIELYLNGSLLTTLKVLNSPYTAMSNTTQPLEIGRSASSSYANGTFSNVSVFNIELSSTQVTEIYNSGKPSDLNTFSGTAPVAWWQLGSNSSFNTNWTCLDEIGTNNAVSVNMTNSDIVDGPGYSASGLGTGSIDIKGDAPYSTANGLSENMDVLDRVTDVPS